MHVQLAPGESVSMATRAAAESALARPGVDAVLLPLKPRGEGRLPRAARRYLAAWDARYLHPMNFFAPAARVASREALPGPRNADAAPALEAILARGGRIEALRDAPVECGIADDLSTWTGWARAEGEAWGRLAAREPRFRGFLPPPPGRHAGWQVPRRVVEELQCTRSPSPLLLLLHLLREASFSAGAHKPGPF